MAKKNQLLTSACLESGATASSHVPNAKSAGDHVPTPTRTVAAALYSPKHLRLPTAPRNCSIGLINLSALLCP